MGDWNRVCVACKEATGNVVEDNWDVHLVVEELGAKVNQQEIELNKLRLGYVIKQRELLLAFVKQVKEHNEVADTINEHDVDAFIQANNDS